MPALAAKRAISTIAIVFGVGDDSVSLGLVSNLARPGGNATGVNFSLGELTAKRFELVRELLPTAMRVAVLVNPANDSHEGPLPSGAGSGRRAPVAPTRRTVWVMIRDPCSRSTFGGLGIFGTPAHLADELCQALSSVANPALPLYMPVLAYADGMRAGHVRAAPGAKAEDLAALLSQALLAFTLQYEDESDLSLAMSADVVRVPSSDGFR